MPRRPKRRSTIAQALAEGRDSTRRAAREVTRNRGLPPGAACTQCGEQHSACLQRHHTKGRHHDPDDWAWTCLNHHAKATWKQLDDGVPLTAMPTKVERVAAALLAQASWKELSAQSDRTLAHQLADHITWLDRTIPDWRREAPGTDRQS